MKPVIDSEEAVFSNNEIGNNSTINGGGGISLKYCRAVTLSNNRIYNNGTNNNGGGLWIQYTHHVGGSDVNLINNTITGNSALSDGGGIYLEFLLEASVANFYNNIIWNNTSGMGSDIYLINDGDLNYIPSPIAISHNNFDHRNPEGIYMQVDIPIPSSNLDNVDPSFVDPENDDYHLKEGSLLINAGDNNAPELPETDMDDEPRIMDNTVDIGADEYPGPSLPIAKFSADPVSGGAPLTVNFTDESAGTVDSWEWNFGDGCPVSLEENPFHIYENSGSYTVSLTVTNAYGSDTAIKEDYIAVTIVEPAPDLKINGEDGPVSVTPIDTANVTVSLDPGSFAEDQCDWWIGTFTPFGDFWLSKWGWMAWPLPMSLGQYPLFNLPEISLLETHLPGGIYIFFFLLDDIPNGIFDSMTWYDYVVVISSAGASDHRMEALRDFDSLFQEKIKKQMRE